MSAAVRSVLLVLPAFPVLIGLALGACARVAAAPPVEHPSPGRLSALVGASAAGPSTAVELDLVLVERGGAPVPFGLLELRWDEGGRTAFQSDAGGRLRMRFAPPLPSPERGDAAVRVVRVPEGQAFAGDEDYEAFAEPLEGAFLRVVARAVPGGGA